MAQNITLLGATYSAVPAVQLPKSGGGTALFTDVTDTTAAAEDVAQGKQFYAADGTLTQGTASGGGSTTLKYGVLRPDAELVTSYKYDKYINADEGVTMPAYTTTSTTLLASETLSPTVSLDLTNYNYEVLIRTLTIPEYSITTKAKGRTEFCFGSALYEVCEFPANTFSALIEPTRKLTSRSTTVYAAGNGSRMIYYSSGTAIGAYASAAYGPNQTIQAPTISSTTLTLKSPIFIIRGSTTYYVNTFMNATTDVRYQYIIDIYRSPKNNLNLDGWGVYTQSEYILDCVYNNNQKLK